MAQTHFGYQAVDEREKVDRVRGVFDSVASRYDVMNDLMSAGLHRAWKAYTVAVAALRETSVLFAAVLGTWLLKEPFGLRRALGTLAIVSGVMALRLA